VPGGMQQICASPPRHAGRRATTARARARRRWPTHTASRSSAPEIVLMRNSMPQTAAAEAQALIA
jgi:hypothetical protein